MGFSVDTVLLVASFLLFVSIVASKVSARMGFPTLLIFLAVGILASTESIGWGKFTNYYTARVLGTITLSIILFAGGMDTDFKHTRPILYHGLLLSTVGVVLTAVSIGYCIYWLTDFSLTEGLLMGAIVSSTDAAAVFAVLRSRNMGLKEHLIPTLELESGSNDAMAYFMMSFFLKMLTTQEQSSFMAIIPAFGKEMLIGALAGILMGKLMQFTLQHINLAYDALYPPLSIAMTLFTYTIANTLHGNGFLSVYLAGMVLGSKEFMHKKGIMRFYDAVSWMMQAWMFIALGLLVSPQKLWTIAPIGLLICAALMFAARPLGVFVSLLPTKVSFAAKVFISWVGLRGAVPIVFATYPLLAGVDKADTIFHLIFFIVFASVLLQGSTLHTLARLLQLEAPSLNKKHLPVRLADSVQQVMHEITVSEQSTTLGKKIVNLGMPESALIVLISRNNQHIIPRGNTIIEAGDRLMVMTQDQKSMHNVHALLNP